jgi:hypothetical protein
MGCFSLSAVEHLLIWLVVLCAVVAFVRLVMPAVFAQLGQPGSVVIGALNIVMWAVVCVVLIIVVFDLLSCLAPLR